RNCWRSGTARFPAKLRRSAPPIAAKRRKGGTASAPKVAPADGNEEKKPLGKRYHECRCGASCSRDENAARVLLAWAAQQLSGREPADAWRTVRPANPPGEPACPHRSAKLTP